MTFKIFRRGSARCIGLLSAFVTILLCLYYISIGQPNQQKDYHNPKRTFEALHRNKHRINASNMHNLVAAVSANNLDNMPVKWDSCPVLTERMTDITTITEFAKFDFQPEWMKSKEFWDKTFETKFEQLKANANRPPLKVIIVPHSHNDPGWLKTFTNYFQSDSRQILNFVVSKLQQYTDMTFIWSEISILQLWWDQAHPTKQRALKHLIDSGRFEITTGGWVMTDEANVHVYAMIDQLIEGHQWLKMNLNYTPKTGWSVDPFGHGSTVPYLLSESGFDGTIIQRIHYAWKQWLANRQYGDFIWQPYWQQDGGSILTHNMPFDIYSIKHSCGPHPFICLNFDFRKVPGEYTEYSVKAQTITDENVQERADLLMEQYERTASLYPHNVALIPLGDDFRYNKEPEVEQQYSNYKKLMDYINGNRDRYKAEISFGLPTDYFRAIKQRTEQFPTLKGDFFVYADIFTEGRPAYWSGYFTTRPSYKLLSRELENQLRTLEILYTIAFNRARQHHHTNPLRIFEKNYEQIVLARRNLGLFQHHDAITGTSKATVMRDYGSRLFESIQSVVRLQETAIELLIQSTPDHHSFILSELERDGFNKLPKKTPITVNQKRSVDVVVFNSLAQTRLEVVLIRSTTASVKVVDPSGKEIDIQINPVWNLTENYDIQTNNLNKIKISDHQFEISFIATLPGLSLQTYTVSYSEDYRSKMSTIYCNDCRDENLPAFNVKNKQPGDIQLENYKMRLLFDEQTGFLKTVTRKDMGKPIQCAVKFAAYRSAQYHSGAYLFKTDPEQRDAERDVLEPYASDVKILITSGPLASEVTVVYGPFLAHTVRLFNTKTELDKAIYIENDVDFEPAPKNRETELFMRFVTELENGEPPEFFTDQNSFQFHRRQKVPQIGVEGNYFPITSAAFLQDARFRMTLVTAHAQGAASLEPGQLEVMIDRRTLYDDYRGMGEGVVDSSLTRHRYWLIFEEFETASNNSIKYETLSYFANQLANSVNYPANLYFMEPTDSKLTTIKNVTLLNSAIPCDVHLLNLRTQTDDMPLFPSRNALLVLHRQGYNCRFRDSLACESVRFSNKMDIFRQLKLESLRNTSLTGLTAGNQINGFSRIYIRSMEVRTFNLTFS